MAHFLHCITHQVRRRRRRRRHFRLCSERTKSGTGRRR